MILAFLCLLVALLAACVMLYFGHKRDNFGLIMTGGVGGLLIMIFGCMGFAFIPQWYAASYKAALINKAYGTAYTQQQIFYAEDIIDEIRELKRKRVELNGDLMKDEEAP